MLRTFKTDAELAQLRQLIGVDPDLLDVHFAVKVCNEMGYPDARVEVFAYCNDENTDLIKAMVLILRHKYTRAYIAFKLLNCGTIVDLDSLLDKISEIFEEFNDFVLHATKSELSEHARKYLSKKFDFSSPTIQSVTFYISDDEQIKMQQKDVLLPDGFEFSKLDAEKDATLVNETWTIATAPDGRNTKSKIVHLPNVAVRRKDDGKLVAFVMLFSFGALNHVYTLPEFRHKGIGTAVQDKMFQTLIAMGICPYWYSAKLMEEVVAVGVAKSEEKMPGRKILRHPDSDEPVIYDCLTFIRR